jgi:hypothetical protein
MAKRMVREPFSIRFPQGTAFTLEDFHMNTAITSGQFRKLLELLEQAHMTPTRFQSIIESGILPAVFDSEANLDGLAVRKALALGPIQMKLVVDYGLSLEQMIVTGHYDWVNDSIAAERFPIVGEGKMELEVQLFHFDQSISSEEAVRLIRKDGFEPAKIEHLLAFGATYPEMQRKFPIVGFGSSCMVYGERYVPVLYGGDSVRSLRLSYWDGDWRDFYRFLAVRNLLSGS